MDQFGSILYQVVVFVALFRCAVGLIAEPQLHPYVDPLDREEPWSSVSLSVIIEPGKEECFFQKVREGIKFEMAYHATSKDIHSNMRVIVTTERGERLYASYIQAEDTFKTVVQRDATYAICFGNQGSRRHSRTVAMTIDMIEEARVKEYFQLQQETAAYLGNSTEILARMWRHVWRAYREQFRLRIGTQQDETLMANNADYILYWSVAQAVIIMTAGIAQVWALRSLFNVKTLTPTQKPRC